MRTALLVASAAVVLGVAGMACGKAEGEDGDATSRTFATKAVISNLFEIQAGKLALQRSEDQAIRSFAQRMIEDHTRANVELKAAAQKDGVTDLPDQLDEMHRRKLEALQGADATDFDRQYLESQLTAHQDAVALFVAHGAHQGALGNFVGETLPILREHRQVVRRLASRQNERP